MAGVERMRRWRALVTPIALAVALCFTTLVWTTPAHAAEGDDPLEVTITSLTPSSIPRKGPVVITGLVRNTSAEDWTTVRVYPVFSSEPMGAPEEVAAAAASVATTTDSGSRLTDEGLFQEISHLAPGDTAAFRLRVPRRKLPITGAPGVYWAGAQALGTSDSGRDRLADGRARTFISLVPRRSTAQLSLVAPLRQYVERDVHTRIDDPVQTAALFAQSGRLGRLVDTLGGESAITWLVDPALLDVAADLGDNNPPLSLGPEQQPKGPEQSPSPEDNQGAPVATLDQDAREQTTQWLSTISRVLAAANVLALPYADADVMALMRKSPYLLDEARTLATTRLMNRGITSAPAIAPPDGHVDAALLAAVKGNGIALAHATAPTSPASGTIGTHRVVLTQPAAVAGGPGPGRRQSALNLRQRILAEAALHAISGSTEPLVIMLPDAWDPGGRWQRADFTEGLHTPWLSLVRLPGTTSGEIGDLPYSQADRRDELDRPLLGQVQRLIRASDVLSSLLDTENNVSLRLRAMALRGASYPARADQPTAASLVSTMSDTVKGLTNKVSVGGTQFVTLSGGSGTITLSLINSLPQPVKIGLDVQPRQRTGIKFEKIEPVTLQPDQRTTMRLQVRTSRLGVNDVTISPTTADGARIGTPLEVTIRSSEVGRWFWSLMIGAGAVLVVMIGRRIRDRIRHRHWRPVKDEHPDIEDPA